MPRRNDIQRILLLGSGPIRIGQAAEFDFSGSQACRALREDGFEVILVVLICLVLKFIWVLPIFFTKQVRCMHDIITSTFVITNRTV